MTLECYVSFGVSRKALLVILGMILCFTKLAADQYMMLRALDVQGNLAALQYEAEERMAHHSTDTRRLRSFAAAKSYNLEEMSVTKGRSLSTDSPSNGSKYAYAFVIGGCNPNKPSYRGFVYNILVTARLLKEQGSTADIVAFFQLSNSYKRADTLPEQDVKALSGLGVHIRYIPQSEHESFYDTVMNKFRILQLTQYRRVLLLDGDVMPVANLDYLFQLSDDNKFGPGNSTLKGNVVVAGPLEPSNAGFFMLTPGEGEYQRIQEIIHNREKKVQDKDGVKFDVEEGWGHTIEAPDEWVARNGRGRKWDFHFAFSDQGLLYHWVKYVKKDFSIIFQRHVENWSADENGKPMMEQKMFKPFRDYSKPLINHYLACAKFMCDFSHFSGAAKPWLRKPPADLSEATWLTNANHIWWHFLKIVDTEQNLDLDFDNWKTGQRPTLGLYAKTSDMDKRVDKRKNAVADQIESKKTIKRKRKA